MEFTSKMLQKSLSNQKNNYFLASGKPLDSEKLNKLQSYSSFYQEQKILSKSRSHSNYFTAKMDLKWRNSVPESNVKNC